jgi:hypothetical protein
LRSLGSAKKQSACFIRTTPIPLTVAGYAWVKYFDSQFAGLKEIAGYHNRMDTIVMWCWPADEPKLIEEVDAAVKYANEKSRTGST